MYKEITEQTIAQFFKELEGTEEVSFDLETWGTDFFTDKVRLAQYGLDSGIWLLNLEAFPTARGIFKTITTILQASKKTVVGHNLKFDMKFTLTATGVLLTNVYDTMGGEVIITMGVRVNNYPSLEELANFYCNAQLEKDTRLLFTTSPVITQEMLTYSAIDVKYLSKIKKYQLQEAENKELTQVFKLEMKLLPVVAMMEFRGIKLDKVRWLDLYKETTEKSTKFRAEFYTGLFEESPLIEQAIAGSKKVKISTNYLDNLEYISKYVTKKFLKEIEDYKLPKKIVGQYAHNLKRTEFIYDFFGVGYRFNKTKSVEACKSFLVDAIIEDVKETWNIKSNQQLLAVLKNLGYNLYSKKKEGETTGQAQLVRYINDKLIQDLLEFRKYEKRSTTYGENWLDHIHPLTGYIHCDWNQLGTDTGRFSANSPNLQNIISEAVYRNCFIAREGYKMFTIDYSQAELRFVGWVSQEPKIIEAYLNGEDIHAKTASLMFDVPIEDVTKEQRSRGKTLNFSILYGSSPKGIAERNSDITFDEAKDLVQRFFNGYPVLAQYIKDEGNSIFQRKYSITPFGRKRFFEDKTVFEDERGYFIHMGNVKREGVNCVIQGGSADAMKLAMVNAWYKDPFPKGTWYFVLQVHDEVSVEVKPEYGDKVIEYIQKHMEEAEQIFLGKIPAVAEVATQKDENGVEQKILDYWTK